MFSMWSDLLKGYSISDKGHGNFKLPLLFVVMLLPLIFNGAGKFSLDHLLAQWLRPDTTATPVSDAYAWSMAAAIMGLPFLMLMPGFGIALLLVALVLAGFGRYARA
jgi:putative oxidoreductase